MSELDLASLIRDVPDFPTEGIMFKDVMPLIADPVAFRETIDRLAAWAGPRIPDLILGAEARGFIFGGALAYALGCGFVTARKPGKLPWETIEARYALEYGTDALEVTSTGSSPARASSSSTTFSRRVEPLAPRSSSSSGSAAWSSGRCS